MLQGLLEAIKKKKIVAIMLVVGALLLIVASFLVIRSRGGKAEKPAPSDSSESSYVESSASGAEGSSSQSSPEGSGVSAGEVVADASSAVPPGPVTLTGVDISSLGLCVVLPAGTGIVDPNVPKSKEARYQPVTTLRNGKHSEVSLRFSDNTIAMSTMPVICLQGFDLGSTLPEDALYEVEAEIKNSKTYTYGEIADKVLYSAEGKLVLDVTFARTESPQTAMDKHITKFEGKQLIYSNGSGLTAGDLLADGSYVYKYDWMTAATQYLREHIGEMIAPVQYATPHTLGALGYQFEIGGTSKASPYMAVVSSATVRADAQNGHSGVYSVSVYGGERLLGDYTVLQPTSAKEGDTAGNPSSFALLQAFKRSELERPDAAISFLRRSKPKSSGDDYYKIYAEGPFSEFSLTPDMLEDYVVFRDNDIVVYNFFDFAKPPPLTEQLSYLADAEGYEQYSTLADGTATTGTALLSAPGGIGRYIRKA